MGNMNAQIGGSRIGYEHALGPYAFGKKTDNGEKFIQFCAMNDTNIGTSLFDHKDIHRTVWNSNDHCTFAQIDHIAIGPRWRTLCLQDVRVYRGADAFSNHQLVITKIKVKFNGQKRKTINVRRFDTSKLRDPFVES